MPDRIRPYRESDASGLAALMHRAIREGAADAYTPEQLEAWSPAPVSAQTFANRVAGQTVLVADDERGPAGFFTLDADGRLDLAFVRPDRKGDGLADQLHDAVLDAARAQGLSELTVEASHLAHRFLSKRGWTLIKTQSVDRSGVELKNHIMRRGL